LTLRPPLRIPGITDIPPSASGMRIGLFGGSFNPMHEGHLLVMEETLRRLALDALWVLVTPGNPLKNNHALPPLESRVRAARALIRNPRIRVTGFEAAKGFAYSWQTVDFLTTTLTDRRFVWIMGADSLADFHRWQRWRDIAARLAGRDDAGLCPARRERCIGSCGLRGAGLDLPPGPAIGPFFNGHQGIPPPRLSLREGPTLRNQPQKRILDPSVINVTGTG
jgi:hypothetical protein